MTFLALLLTTKRSGRARVNDGSHSFTVTCHQHVANIRVDSSAVSCSKKWTSSDFGIAQVLVFTIYAGLQQ